MSQARYSIVIVPGHGNSGPDHWQSHLENSRPGSRRVIQKNWTRPIRWSWVNALERVLREVEAPVVLVGHSAGALTIVHWAARSHPRVVGALLVAPPDMQVSHAGFPPPWVMCLAGWWPVPLRRLPFRSMVVASSNDPMCSIERARSFANAWGSSFVDIGQAGHINSDSGHGEWAEGYAFLQQFMA